MNVRDRQHKRLTRQIRRYKEQRRILLENRWHVWDRVARILRGLSPVKRSPRPNRGIQHRSPTALDRLDAAGFRLFPVVGRRREAEKRLLSLRGDKGSTETEDALAIFFVIATLATSIGIIIAVWQPGG